nr:hypothetical protein ZC449.2 - Caenorhabditis elegans [Caenorhabditis elegans]
MLPQRLNGVDQSSCLMYCSQNINAIGQNIPCYSLNYEPTNEICEMYGEQTRNESDSATLAIDDEHNFGDKFCIKTKYHCDAETLYPVHLYKKLMKNIIARVPGLASKISCLSECIENRECKVGTEGFQTGSLTCFKAGSAKLAVLRFMLLRYTISLLAVTYKNGMCVLHSVSPSEDESLLLDGSGKTMVIENGCHVSSNTNKSVTKSKEDSEESESSWQEWSLCQYGVKGRKMRVRQRECDDCEENMQVEEC